MKTLGLVPKKFNSYDEVGLYMLFTLLILNPFHFLLFDKFVFYRELFAFIFLVLGSMKIYSFYSHQSLFIKSCFFSKELFFISLFSVLLMLFALMDPGINLYDIDNSGTSLHLNTVNPAIYVLRNAFIYLPMVLYFSLRGLNENEIKRIAFITVIVAPFSILFYIYHEKMATITTLILLVKLYGYKFNYNSYIPYLTFPLLASIYLLFTDSSRIIKLVSFTVLVILTYYILLSFSRQSVLFIVLFGVIFILAGRGISLLKKMMFLIIYLLFIIIPAQQLTQCSDIKYFIERYSISLLSLNSATISKPSSFSSSDHTSEVTYPTSRIEIAKYGISLLKPSEFITGAGLTSVINSGPHNDYIRWMQRVGILVMIIGFLPFFIVGWRSFCCSLLLKENSLFIFLGLSAGFTIYHSIFGYPREDAYQSIYCFLSLAMWLGINKELVMVPLNRPLKSNLLLMYTPLKSI